MIHSIPSGTYQYLGENPEKGLREIIESNRDELKSILETKKPVPKRLLLAAANFPEVVIELGPDLPFQNPQIAQIVSSNSLTAFYLLISNYHKLADRLEAIVLNDGQYTLELLQQASRHKIKLKHTIEHYESSILQDPYFANIYNRLAPGRKILDRYTGEGLKKDPENAAEAFLQLSIAKSTGGSIPQSRLEKCQEMLHTRPLYALIGSTRLKTMGLTIDAEKVKHLTPKYASALLHYGVIQGKGRLIDKLLINPLWMAHYIITHPNPLSLKEIRDLHAKMKQTINDTDNQAYRLATKAINNLLKTLQ